MAGLLPPAERALLLDELTSGSNYLGLAEAIASIANPVLSSITEVTTDGYVREAVTWHDAVVSDEGVAKVLNDGEIELGPYAADMGASARYAFLTNVATGTAGRLKYVWELVDPIRARAGKPVKVRDGALIIE